MAEPYPFPIYPYGCPPSLLAHYGAPRLPHAWSPFNAPIRALGMPFCPFAPLLDRNEIPWVCFLSHRRVPSRQKQIVWSLWNFQISLKRSFGSCMWSAWFKTGLILAILISFHFYNWATHMLHMFDQLENRSLLFWSYCGVISMYFIYTPLSEDFSPTSVLYPSKRRVIESPN